MSIYGANLSGLQVRHVQTRPDGFPRDALIKAHQMVLEDNPAAVGMIAALERVIDSGAMKKSSKDIVEVLRKEGKTLMGASFMPLPYFPVGLLYAEGERAEPNDPVFSVVRMGTWVVAAGKEIPFEQGVMWGQGRKIIGKAMVNLCLTNAEASHEGASHWRIPVSGMTKVEQLFAEPGEEAWRPYIYGHRQDLQALAEADISPGLRARIEPMVGTFWAGELEAHNMPV